MKINRCSYLLAKYKDGLCTIAERNELLELLSLLEMEEWLKQEVDKEILAAELMKEEYPEILSDDEAEKVFGKIMIQPETEDIPVIPITKAGKTGWLKYAAAVLLIVGVGAFFIWKNIDFTQLAGNKKIKQEALDIDPGTNGAILTLADGTTVLLDSLQDGVVAQQNGALAILKAGELNYDAQGNAKGSTSYNTITTPKGRQFNLVLSDGTKVWLNAGSSLMYPTVFTGKERRVLIKGEAYFEVAHNKASPFLVNIDDKAEVKVLGTHFNINAYADEPSINATLIEGSVSVQKYVSGKPDKKSPGVILKPGHQARITDNELINVVKDVSVERVMAWKNGIFNFDDAGLEEVMRQLERWYNIEVIYERGIPDIVFWGKMERNLTLSAVLGILERSEVHFKIEQGRKLIVLP